MRVTVAQYAAMCGVSRETIEWLTTDPATRPAGFQYVAVPEVLTTQGSFARLWGAGDKAVRYQVGRGLIPQHARGRVNVHEADLSWGLSYWDQACARLPPSQTETELRVWMTIEMQAIERELIRLGHLPPADRVEKQLECLVRSPEWWRRNRQRANGADAAAGTRTTRRQAVQA